MKVPKTVIGSFPVKNKPLEDAIKEVVETQLKYDINIVSDGEQRADMINYFGDLPGVGRGPRGPFVQSKISPYNRPEDFIKFHDLEIVRKYLAERGKIDVGVKITITGPITLAFYTALNGLKHYSSLRDVSLYNDFAEALAPIVFEAYKRGYYIQVDEPALSAKVIDSKLGVSIVNRLFDSIPYYYKNGRTSVHVCGQLNQKIFRDLLDLDAHVISLAFSAQNVQKNVELLNRQLLHESGKGLGVGCVNVQAKSLEDVESVDVVAKRIMQVREAVGEEHISAVHPDCGLRPLSEQVAEAILDRMCKAMAIIDP
ncbi:MAG: hypothetical protein ACPLZF_02955 [Nitrososphaeria archaeon]